ncbi:glycosyltransferase family 32 protein [Paenibacillus sp. NPDC101420]|uniref:glycosyltransferase family 32 protein n=1 Tax=Paenibacillus sp. NPDC101420 TaxID=3390602 RepID=UPI003CFBE0B9
MIPKKIHYCWFGGNPLPLLAIKCIESWRKHCPDYEIIEWNETNFDIDSNEYVKQAYEAKKYAFVSDYVRLSALYHCGGIYMDTDVEVIKPLDEFLEDEAFSGFETPATVSTAIMGCKQHDPFFEILLSYYNGRKFIKSDGSYDLTTNVTVITSYCVQNGLKLNNTHQTKNGFTMYPQKYFCPKDHVSGSIELRTETYTIHHFAGSWVSSSAKRKKKLYKLFGKRMTNIIVSIKKNIRRIFST